MMKTKITKCAPSLVVSDVRRTAEYYRDVLGFKILGYFMEPPVYAMVARDSCEIHLGKSDAEQVQYNRTIRSISFDFIIWVDDFDEFYAEVTGKGAAIVQQIVRRNYGREFVIRDIDGHDIHIVD